jgi:hypothetical protein
MKRLSLLLLLVCAPVAMAQNWEVGVGVGGAFYNSQTFSNAVGSANASLASGLVTSAWLGNNSHNHWGGEVRYDYENTELKLSSGATSASFAANTQAIHYDFLYHFTSQEAPVRPFVAAGGGVKFFHGTGKETVSQPLQSIGLLTKTTETKGLISVGAGVKFNFARIFQLRVEAHDYITPFPTKVITPNVGTKTGGWLMDFVPMAALAVTF